jgi:hypothetical protein
MSWFSHTYKCVASLNYMFNVCGLDTPSRTSPTTPSSLASQTCLDVPPTPLMDSTMSLKGENNKRTRSWGTLPGLQHFGGVEGRARASGWGLGRVISKLITHMDLHKPNNKLVSV